ncbi:MAG TPA: DNA-directed RNA polymerase subunit alpha C-terminal domain-containing protein [Thermaerobacter sp.]
MPAGPADDGTGSGSGSAARGGADRGQAAVPPAGISLAAIPLSLLEIPPRVRVALQQRGYETVGDLASQADPRLLAARGMGTRGLLALATELARVMADPAYQRQLLARVGRYDPSRFPDAVRHRSIDELGLSQRAYRALRRSGIQTIGQLLELGEAGLRRLRGLGPRSLAEICHRLDALQSGRPLPPPGGAGDPLAPDLMDDPAPLAVLLLPRRVVSALQRAGLQTVGAVAGFSQEGLRRLRGLGESGIAAILEALRRYREECSQREAVPRDLEDWLRELVEPLADREREVLVLRYGLLGAEPHDLGAIAARWQTTRQWVSVVQGRALRRARARARLPRFRPLVTAVRAVATRCGAAGTAELAEALRQDGAVGLPASSEQAVRLVGLIVQVTPGLRRAARSLWTTVEIAQGLPEAAKSLEAYLEERGRPASLADLAAHLAGRMHDLPADPEAMARAVVATQEAFIRYPGGLYGLTAWRGGRRVRARDYLVRALERHGRPLHYTELTRLVNELLPEGRKMPPTHVLTILSSGEPFRRFDRGIYGLSHWQRQPEHGLTDLCRDALAEHGEPSTLDQVVEAVQRRHRYPRRTVARVLNEDPAVLRYGRDRFGLGAWLAVDPRAAGTVRAPVFGPRPTNLAAVRGLLAELLAGHVYDTAQLTAYLGRWRQRSQARQIIAYLQAMGWLTGVDDTWTATPVNDAWVRAGTEAAQLTALALADPGFAHALVLHEAFRRLTAGQVDGRGGGGPRAASQGGGMPTLTAELATRWLADRVRRAAAARGEVEGPEFLLRLRRQWLVTGWFDPWVAPLLAGRAGSRADAAADPGQPGWAAGVDGASEERDAGPVAVPGGAASTLGAGGTDAGSPAGPSAGTRGSGGPAADEPAVRSGPTRVRSGTPRQRLWDLAARQLWPCQPVHVPAAWLPSPATAWAVLADAVASQGQGRAVDLAALLEWCRSQDLAANAAKVEGELFGLGLWPALDGDRLRLYMPYRLVVPPEGLRLPGLREAEEPLAAAAEVLERAGVFTALPAHWPSPPVAEAYGVPPLAGTGTREAAAHGEGGGDGTGTR